MLGCGGRKSPPDLDDEQIGQSDIGPEIDDQVLHLAAIGLRVVHLDGVALPREAQHGADHPAAIRHRGACPGDDGLVERLALGPYPDPDPDPGAAHRARH